MFQLGRILRLDIFLEPHRRVKFDIVVQIILVGVFEICKKIVRVLIVGGHPEIDFGFARGFWHVEIDRNDDFLLLGNQSIF